MASDRQKEIKVAHLLKQVERFDGRIAKAKHAVAEAENVVASLESAKKIAVDRLKWQQAEPVSATDDDGDGA